MRALGSAFLSIALLSLNAGQARAVAPPPPSGYAIDILNANPSGLTVTINGSASADPYQGQGNSSQQRITVTSWGDSPNVPTTVNPNFTFSNPKKFTATWSASHTYAQSGTYTITAKVCHESCNQNNSNNQHNHSDTDTIQVTVTNPNLPPVLTNTPSGTVSIPALAAYTFDANATDPNIGDTLTFTLSGQPSGASINGSTGVFTWTPSNGQADHTYTFTVRVSDGQLSSSRTVTLRVNEIHNDDDDCDHEDHHCDDDDEHHTTIRLNGSATVTVAFDGTYAELGAVCTRDHHDSAASVSGSVNTHVAGNYVLTYRCTHDDETVASVTRTVTVQPEIIPLAACADTSDNDEDGLVDAADPGCHTDGNANNSESYDAADTSEYNVTAGSTQCSDLVDNDGDGQIDMEDSNCSSLEDNNEGNDGGAARGVLNSISSNSPTGEVLGATTSTTSTVPTDETPSCGAYITTYMRYGGNNDSEDVKRLQSFLNENLSIALDVTGFFGTLTRDAVKTFQVKYHDDILAPWANHGLTAYEQAHGTGNVYKTTQRKINMLKCAQLDIPLPDLSQ